MHDAARIKALRERRDLTQAEAATLAGITVQQWSDIETERVGSKRGVTLSTLDKIAKALGVTAKELLK